MEGVTGSELRTVSGKVREGFTRPELRSSGTIPHTAAASELHAHPGGVESDPLRHPPPPPTGACSMGAQPGKWLFHTCLIEESLS